MYVAGVSSDERNGVGDGGLAVAAFVRVAPEGFAVAVAVAVALSG
jgi:hypothetical protein